MCLKEYYITVRLPVMEIPYVGRLMELVLPYGQPFLFLLTFAYTTTSKLILLHQECKLTYDYQQIFLVDILVM